MIGWFTNRKIMSHLNGACLSLTFVVSTYRLNQLFQGVELLTDRLCSPCQYNQNQLRVD